MRKMSFVGAVGLAAAVVGTAGSAARATLTVSAVREAGPTTGTTAILLYALGSGVDSTLSSYDLSISDVTEAGIQMGGYQLTGGPKANRGYYTDISGAQPGVLATTDASGIPISYTWIGNGHGSTYGIDANGNVYSTLAIYFDAAPTASTIVTPTANGNVVTPANDTLGEGAFGGKPASTPAGSDYAGPLSGLSILGDTGTPFDATGATSETGGYDNANGFLLGVVVVKSGDEVKFTGNFGSGTLSDTDSYSVNGAEGYSLSTDYATFSIDSTGLLLGDANGDGKVDLSDLNIVLNNLGTTTSLRSNGNFDGAATIDLTDLNDVLNNLGTSSSPSVSETLASAVPEPASLSLMAIGGLLVTRRRHRA